MNEEKISKLKEIIEKSNNIVCFTGAGTSTESGVPDYRSENGIYNTCFEFGVRPEEILYYESLSKRPDVFWEFYRKYFLGDAKPNKFHFFLKSLQEKKKLKAVITQNVDDLFEQAGLNNIIHIHGTSNEYYCTYCGKQFSKEYIKGVTISTPRCTCGCLIRPNVCLYGERPNIDAEKNAIKYISNADMVIVAGSSLKVYPAAGYLKYFAGNNMIIINNEQTDFDDRATLIFNDAIGEVVDKIII